MYQLNSILPMLYRQGFSQSHPTQIQGRGKKIQEERGNMDKQSFLVAFTRAWWNIQPRTSRTSIECQRKRKRKSPNTPNGVRAIVYPTQEIKYREFSDACHGPNAEKDDKRSKMQSRSSTQLSTPAHNAFASENPTQTTADRKKNPAAAIPTMI